MDSKEGTVEEEKFILQVQEGEDDENVDWYDDWTFHTLGQAQKQWEKEEDNLKKSTLGQSRGRRKPNAKPRFNIALTADMDLEGTIKDLRHQWAANFGPTPEEREKEYKRPEFPKFRIIHQKSTTVTEVVQSDYHKQEEAQDGVEGNSVGVAESHEAVESGDATK